MSKTLPGFSLNSFISSPSGDWYKNVSYEDAKNMIKEKMMSSAENFVAIGYYLKRIDETGQYKEGGYASIWDCARQEFGFSQSKASRCINICRKYSADGDSPYINERFKNFDISQLQEMLPIRDDHLIEQITPDMSTREIRNMRNAGDAKDEADTKILKGQMQLTTVEGEYREFTPAPDVPDKESPVQKQDTVSGEAKKTRNDTENLGNDQISDEKTCISSVSKRTVLDMEGDQRRGTTDRQEGGKDPRTDNEDTVEHFCYDYDLERVQVLLPCSVGETVYFYEGGSLEEGTVDQITLGEQMKPLIRVYDAGVGAWFYFEAADFGVIVFFTKERN